MTRQLDLFGMPVAEAPSVTPESPKPPPKPRLAPRPKPAPVDPPVRAGGGDVAYHRHACARCAETWMGPAIRGIALCANCAGVGASPDALPNVHLEERCILIGCSCVTTGAEIEGRPICELHNTEVTREVMATGSWPAWYAYEGKWRVVPTVRRLDDLGHAWLGVTTGEKRCSACGLSYLDWQKNRFAAPCANYRQPTKKGLFRP